jgi:hypothetical protein
MQHLYQGFTLIDITPTGVTSSDRSKIFERNQQRNWETVQQILGLRTQPTILSTNNFEDDVNRYFFGINFSGKHRIWTFKFSVEYLDVYRQGPDRFGLLKRDFRLTPATLNLNETITPPQATFDSMGPWNNTYFNSLV